MKILLLGREECQATRALRGFIIELGHDVDEANSAHVGQKFPANLAKAEGDLLISFRSHFIVPKNLLRQWTRAINFHIGPPEHPGFGSASFALYERAKEFGVTAHLMEEHIDKGEILAVQRFPIEPDDNLPSLLTKAHDFALALAKQFLSTGVFETATAFSGEWGEQKGSLAALESLSTIVTSDSDEEIARKIRACNHPSWPVIARLGDGFEFIFRG